MKRHVLDLERRHGLGRSFGSANVGSGPGHPIGGNSKSSRAVRPMPRSSRCSCTYRIWFGISDAIGRRERELVLLPGCDGAPIRRSPASVAHPASARCGSCAPRGQRSLHLRSCARTLTIRMIGWAPVASASARIGLCNVRPSTWRDSSRKMTNAMSLTPPKPSTERCAGCRSINDRPRSFAATGLHQLAA